MKKENLKIAISVEIEDKKWNAGVFLTPENQTKEKFIELGKELLWSALRKLCEAEIIENN